MIALTPHCHLFAAHGAIQTLQAEIDFGYATTVLGKEGSVDFLDSSPWPFSVIDAFININECLCQMGGAWVESKV